MFAYLPVYLLVCTVIYDAFFITENLFFYNLLSVDLFEQLINFYT